jgi:hypothetical protein
VIFIEENAKECNFHENLSIQFRLFTRLLVFKPLFMRLLFSRFPFGC